MSLPVVGSSGGEDEEIRILTEQLQYELGSLSSTHSILEADMQRLASMLAPYMTPAGRLNLPESGVDPKVFLFKQGLDFRISEYNEDCHRLESVQERLQRKLEEAAGSYERTFMGASGLADARIIRRLEELQRVIQVQQSELDQARFERDVVADEAKRLRQMFLKNGPAQAAKCIETFNAGPGSLHTATAARFAPMAGPTTIHTKQAPRQFTEPSYTKISAPQFAAVPKAPPVAVAQPSAVPQSASPVPSAGWGDWWSGKPVPTANKDFL